MKQKSLDMTKGNPFSLIIRFAIPLFIGNIFQQFYNMIDAIVVGQFVGIKALAAVGASSSSYALIIAVINGFTSGASVVIAQIYGSGDSRKVRKAYITTWKILSVAGIVFTAVGLLVCGKLLRILGTPEDVYRDAHLYILVMSVGILATCLYNGLAAFLRSVGNSTTPLAALVISSIVNIVLDLVLVIFAGMGVSGVAIATLIAQLISGLYCLIYVKKTMPELSFGLKELKMDDSTAREMIRIGLPATFSTVVVTLSTMFIQAAVNRYGSTVVGAYTVDMKVENICFCLAFSIGLSTGVFCGQNIGAGDEKRTVKGFHTGLLIAVIYCSVMALFSYIFAPGLVRIFSSEPEVISIGVPIVRITACFSPVLGMVFVVQHFLRNVSDVRPTIVMSFAEIFSRGVLPFVLSSWFGYYGIWWATPIGWSLSLIIGFIRYRSGKWRGKALQKV